MVAQTRSPKAKYCFVHPGEEPEKGEQTYSIDIRSILDPSKGKRGKLPVLKYPQNPEQASDRYEGFQKETERFFSEMQSLPQQRSQLTLSHYKEKNSTQESRGHIIREIILSLKWRDVTIRELNEKLSEAEKDYGEALKRTGDSYNKGIIEVGKITDEKAKRKAERELKMRCMGMMKPDIERVDKAIREYFEEWSFIASMLGTAVGDEAWQKDIALIIQIEQTGRYHHLTSMAAAQSILGMIEQGHEDVSETLERVQPEKCEDNKSYEFELETPDESFGAGVSVDCNGISFEVTGAHLSLELSLDNKGGYTVFGGPKVGVNVGGTGADVKAGYYVSGSVSGGTIKDAGVMIRATTSVGAGPVSVSSTAYEQSLSFVPAFQ